MAFFPRLLLQLVLALLVPAALAWAALSRFFPLTPEQATTVRVAIPVAVVAIELLAFAALWRLSAPLRVALDVKIAESEPRATATLSAHRLPGRMAAIMLALCAIAVGVITFLMRSQGLSGDVALAGDAATGAAGILAAMLTYSLVASATGRALVRIGPASAFHEQGTVRGKILLVGFGLLSAAVMLFASLGYVRYRVDADADYIDGVEQSQQRALLQAHGQVDARIAELAWLFSGAPSALVGANGRVAARFGSEDAPFLAGDLRRLGVERLAGGWIVRRAAGQGAMLVSWLPEGPLEARRADYWSGLLPVSLLAYLAAALVVWFSARAISLPIAELRRAAEGAAAGDLGASPASTSRDELGRLAADFRRMTQGLTALVSAVQEATHGVAQAARELSDIGEQVKRGALDQRAGVVSVDGAVEAMQSSIALVGKGIDGLSEYVASTSGAVGQMATALDAVQRQGAELEQAMDFAEKDVEGLADAGSKAQLALRALDQIAGKTSETLANVNTTLSGLELAAIASQLNAAQAEELAQVAAGVVEETVAGIESLRAAVGDAQRRVTALGRRAADIDQIVDFIADVAGRTNLLSLNASIIATQAGEHGKAFAVVADQTRDLAAQIASSTKSIGDIIRAVRDDVQGTAALISRGDSLAAEGVRLAQNSARSLTQIRGVTAQGSENAARIQSAVQGHVQSSREVSDLVVSVTEGSRAVSDAVQRIGSSVAALETVGRSVGSMADRVSRALEEQSALGRRQQHNLEAINAMSEEITRAVSEHGAATQRVRESLRNLGDAAARHEMSVKEVAGVGERLQARARDLAERVGRFKVS